MLHDLRVCIELGERNSISRHPLPQEESTRSEFDRHQLVLIVPVE